MSTTHIGAYVYPLGRAYSVNRQDGDTEGAAPVLMNLPLYIDVVAWRYGCGGGDKTLENSLFCCLRGVEIVAFL